MRAPTSVRWPTSAEWEMVTDVFKDTMPLRQRVFVTDGLGGGDRPFVIPTSAINVTTIPAAIQAGLQSLTNSATGPVGRALATVSNVTGFIGIGALPAQINGLINLGFFVNVGQGPYGGMTAYPNLLIHEMTHVWQGHNSTSAMTFVANAMLHQCTQEITGRSAYSYTAGSGFRTYNVEQQAEIVEHWHAAGMPSSGPLWAYIRDYVRKGRA